MDFKRGQLVEFTDKYQRDYTLGDPALARYGVVLEDTDGPIVKVQTPDPGFGPLGIAIEVPTNRIHASAWAGWYPDDLDSIVTAITYNGGQDDFDDEY